MRKAIARYLAIGAALAALCVGGVALAQAPANQFQQNSPGSGNAGYPPAATPVVADFAGNVGTTPVALSIPAAKGQFSYLCGLSGLNNGATVASPTATLTITGLGGGSTYTFSFPFAAAGTITVFGGATGLPVVFSPCLIGNALNTAITINVAVEAGNTVTDVNAWGYQQ